MELIEGSETSANHKRTPGKYPKEYIQKKLKVVLECNYKSLSVKFHADTDGAVQVKHCSFSNSELMMAVFV